MQTHQVLFENVQEILCIRVKMIACKLIVTMLSLSAVLKHYTNINVLCSSIGVTGLALQVLLEFKPEEPNDGLLKTVVSKQIRRNKFTLLMLILILQLPCMSLLSFAVWLWFLIPQAYTIYMKHKADRFYSNQDQMGKFVCLVIMFLEHILILLRYETYITLSWIVVFIIVLIVALLIGMILGITTLTFLIQNQPLSFAFVDDDYDQSYDERVHKGKINTIYAIGLYLTFLSLFSQAYLPKYIFEKILLSSLLMNLVELIVLRLFKRSIILYYNYDFFTNNVAVRVSDQYFQFHVTSQSIKKVHWSSHFSQCLFCSQRRACVLHDYCGRLIFCLPCFKKYTKQKNNRIRFTVCCMCNNKQGVYVEAIDKSELTDYLKRRLEEYLEPAEYLIKNLN